MFLNSCLYPFAITLLSIVWLFMANGYLYLNLDKKFKSDQIANTLKLHSQQIMTLINFAMFLPSLWIYASFLSVKGAGDSGLIWLIGSSWDFYAQQKYPTQKRWGYFVALLAIAGLWLGSVYSLALGYQLHS